ncbi:MAG: hypothetical protein JNM17_17100 [Archangium sp.]|nr:hypothetical protein [Archangium sp.]
MRAEELVARFPFTGAPADGDDWRLLQSEITEAIRRGDEAFLLELHARSERHPLLQGWPHQSAFRALAMIQSPDVLRRFLERAKNPPKSELHTSIQPLADAPARNLGALLAYAQDDAMLERELEWFGPEPPLQDLFACWIQERAVRGSEVGRSPFVTAFWERLPSSHPLAVLPLHTVPLEEKCVRTSTRRYDTLGNWFDFEGANWSRGGSPGTWTTGAKELTCDARVMASVLSEEALAPNAMWEGRVFKLDRAPLRVEALSLFSLGLECLGAAPPPKARANTAHEVMSLLLQLGTGGGAYVAARSAAWGRLLAWRSLRALTGAATSSSLEEIGTLAEQCQWAQFESESDWFNHVVIDVGLVCLRPSGEVAVLAMTDSD